MMNGYSSIDLLGRTGKNLSVTVDGQRMLFRGEPAVPCVLLLNGAQAAPSAVVYAGDSIEFTPAVSGASAQRSLKDLLGVDFTGGVTVNGRLADLDTRLNTGDQIVTSHHPVPPPAQQPAPSPKASPPPQQTPPPAPAAASVSPEQPGPAARPGGTEEPAPVAVEQRRPSASPPNPWEKPSAPAESRPSLGHTLQVMLNGKALLLPAKPEGTPYYVMDLLEHSGIDFEHLDRGVELQVNGRECAFSQELRPQDDVVIRYLEP